MINYYYATTKKKSGGKRELKRGREQKKKKIKIFWLCWLIDDNVNKRTKFSRFINLLYNYLKKKKKIIGER